MQCRIVCWIWLVGFGGGNDRASKVDLCVYHTVGSVRMVENTFFFGLKNAPRIYQRLISNALYGYLNITAGKEATATDSSRLTDVFTEGEPEPTRHRQCWA